MRWDELIADIEAQGDLQEDLARDAEVADRARTERSRITLVQRLSANTGQPITVTLTDGSIVPGVLSDVGPDWLLLGDVHSASGECIVPLGAIAVLRNLGSWSDAPGLGPVASRLDLRWLLGRISRDRSAVLLRIFGGPPLSGTIDRLGADHLDLAAHSTDEFRRSRDVSSVVTVPLVAVAMIGRA
jgi:hypothetical protein